MSILLKTPIEPFVHCQIIQGDSAEKLKPFTEQADLIMTSPPYADARKKQYGGVKPKEYANWFEQFHNSFWNALKPSGSLIINIKDKVVDGVRHHYVWQTIQRLEALGWNCIDDYVWVKKNPMPGFWPTRLADGWEYCFHLAKSKKPYVNHEAVKVPASSATLARMNRLKPNDFIKSTSNSGSGFTINRSKWLGREKVLPSNVLLLSAETKNKNHPAVYPISVPQFFIKFLSPVGGLIIDPFAGSGTTGIAALSLGRNCILIDKHKNYCMVAANRLKQEVLQKHSKTVL